ncbi:MAG: phosphatase PAP2 family protein [Marmoricola sp.]
MDSLVVAVAKYGIFVVAAGALLVWLIVARGEKVPLAVKAVVAMLVVAVGVKVAGALHTDPRPFVVNPSLKPLFAHPADNGFPSDHTALTSAVALVVLLHRRWAGLALLVVSLAIGASRVAAHVHHTQDIVAGLVIGAVAALIAALGWRVVESRRG